MFFIILSIASFVLRTLPELETPTYEFVKIYTELNRTEITPIQIREERQMASTFDIIEWICMCQILRSLNYDYSFVSNR